MKHTPAPWKVIKAQRGFVIADDENTYDIAVVRDASDRFDNEANARLIAAAPELLEALKWYLDNDDTNYADHNAFYLSGRNKAEIAIAKATGE